MVLTVLYSLLIIFSVRKPFRGRMRSLVNYASGPNKICNKRIALLTVAAKFRQTIAFF